MQNNTVFRLQERKYETKNDCKRPLKLPLSTEMGLLCIGSCLSFSNTKQNTCQRPSLFEVFTTTLLYLRKSLSTLRQKEKNINILYFIELVLFYH